MQVIINAGQRSLADVTCSLAQVLEAVSGMEDVLWAGAQGSGYRPEQCARLAGMLEMVSGRFRAELEALHSICEPAQPSG